VAELINSKVIAIDIFVWLHEVTGANLVLVKDEGFAGNSGPVLFRIAHIWPRSHVPLSDRIGREDTTDEAGSVLGELRRAVRADHDGIFRHLHIGLHVVDPEERQLLNLGAILVLIILAPAWVALRV
jgi:hypothetical protein